MTNPQHEAAQANTGAAGTTAPGWYPDPTGQLRWWDGSQWGPYQQTAAVPAQQMGMMGGGPADPAVRSQAALAHWLGLLGWIGPLIIYVTSADKDPYIRHHSAEALNFHLTMLIAYVISSFLIIVLIGLLLLPLVWIASIIFSIVGAGAANKGEWYKYPMTIRMVSGAQV